MPEPAVLSLWASGCGGLLERERGEGEMSHMMTRQDEMEALAESPVFQGLTPEEREALIDDVQTRYGDDLPVPDAGLGGRTPGGTTA